MSDTWIEETDNVDRFQLSGNHIGVLKGGHLFVKEGSLTAGWVEVGIHIKLSERR
jgi:hypothetical protein